MKDEELKKKKEVEEKQSNCKHNWEFVDIFHSTFKIPYYYCTECDKVRFIDYDEDGHTKN